MDFVEGSVVLLRERAVLGTDHCAFGAWFATANHLPPPLVSYVGFHHTPDRAEAHRPLVALVAAADDLANHYQMGQTCDGYDPAADAGWPLLAPDVGRGRSLAALAAEVLAGAAAGAAEGVSAAA
jgi:hypothetical protein